MKSKNGKLQDNTKKILKRMLEMLREANTSGVSVEDFIAELQKIKKKNSNSSEADNEIAWDPKGKRSKERTVYRYLEMLCNLGCDVQSDKISGRYVLKSPEWQFPEKTPWSLSTTAIQKVGEKLLPILKDIMLPEDALERIDEGIHICIEPISPDRNMVEVQKTVVTAWVQRKILHIQYNRGKGGRYHVIEPHGLLFRNSEWQVVAKEGSMVKTFFLSRITEAILMEKSFDFKQEVLQEALDPNKKDQGGKSTCEIDKGRHEYILGSQSCESDHTASSSSHVSSDTIQSKKEDSKKATTFSDLVKKRDSETTEGYFSAVKKNTGIK